MAQELSRLARLIITVAGLSALAACGGGGGGSIDTGTDTDNPGANPGNPPGGGSGTQVTVTGRVTFDRLQFNQALGSGLNAASPVKSPAREVVVQAVSNNSTLATTTTDTDGNYSLSVPANRSMFIRARSQMQKSGSPGWTFTVRDNTRSDAIYTLDGESFNSGTDNRARDLHARSGWGGSGYTGQRAAAPFAILDTVYRTKELILSAEPTAQFPELNLYWSATNRNQIDQNGNSVLCPDNGAIITSLYASDGGVDGCTAQGQPLPAGIYILGDYANGNGDTDEFDAHVIAHEFGHYFEDRFSRSDSFGGEHERGDRLDMRVAFGEGWGNAFGAMALNDPEYRDSFAGISRDGGFNLETGNAGDARGWYSESSVGKILWDLFDDSTESGDTIALGFKPIYDAMTGPQVNTEALTSIFSFISALRSQNSGSGTAISALLNREDISGDDAFGRNENNNGGDGRALPVYDEIFLNTPKPGVCSSSVAGSKFGIGDGIPNKLGNHRFLRFTNDASRLVTITAQGAAAAAGTVPATDPDIYVLRRGEVVLAGESGAVGVETISMQQLPAGSYVIDVFDYDTTGTNQPPRCMTVSITG